jgi:alpha-galactosidase
LKWLPASGCDIHRGTDGNGGDCCSVEGIHGTVQLCVGDLSNTSALSCSNATSVTLDSPPPPENPQSLAVAKMVVFGTAPGGAVPTSIRYAYSNYPQCILFNSDRLPAGPFVLPVSAKGSSPADASEPNTNADQKEKKVLTPPAQTPPMGLNSWNSFHCNVDERKMRAMADALVTTGLAKAGYEYVNIDDCWQVARNGNDFNGTINADPVRFPGGIKPLADYVHSKGLKFGLYSAQREFTCQRRPGSWQHEAIDVQTYCDWGVDYLKLDACRGGGFSTSNESWIRFRAAIDECSNKRGYPLVLSVESCDDPDGCGHWVGNLANLWRTCGDIQATFKSVLRNAQENTKMAAHQGPSGGPLNGGRWNDADMLQVGNIGFNYDEQVSHFSLWSIMASPLLIGTDVSMLSNQSLSILGNTEVTAVNQDLKGVQGTPTTGDGSNSSCWTKSMADGSIVAILLNVGDSSSAKITCTWNELGVKAANASVRDLWQHKEMGVFADQYTVELSSHACSMVKITAV